MKAEYRVRHEKRIGWLFPKWVVIEKSLGYIAEEEALVKMKTARNLVESLNIQNIHLLKVEVVSEQPD